MGQMLGVEHPASQAGQFLVAGGLCPLYAAANFEVQTRWNIGTGGENLSERGRFPSDSELLS